MADEEETPAPEAVEVEVEEVQMSVLDALKEVRSILASVFFAKLASFA